MQNCGAALFTILASAERDLLKGDLFEFYAPNVTELCPANASKRYAPTEIAWLGWKYERQAISHSDISKHITGQFNNVTVTLSNVDRSVSDWVTFNDIEGWRVLIRCVSRSIEDDSIVLGVFRCEKPDEIDNTTVRISAKQDLGSIENDLPWNKIQPKCTVKFKGLECLGGQLLAEKSAAYQAATACNRSQQQCAEYANSKAFQGEPFQAVSGNFKVSRNRGGAGGAFLSLLGLGNKRVTAQYSSQQGGSYGRVWPLGLGRTQIELVPLLYADTGQYLAGQWGIGEGEIQAILNLRNISAGWANTFQALATHRGAYGYDAEQAPQGFFTNQQLYHSHKGYVEATILGDNPDTGDIAPTLAATILWIVIPTWDGSAFSGEGWSDDGVEHVRYLLTETRSLGYNEAWIDDVAAGETLAYCQEPMIDETGGEDVYVSTAAGVPGTDYKRYRSTGLLDRYYFRKVLGLTTQYSAEREVVYNSYNPANAVTPVLGTYYRKRYTSNWNLLEPKRAVDFIFKDLLPSFRGYLVTSAQGKLQIRTEKPTITSYVRADVFPDDTAISVEDALAWRNLNLPEIFVLVGVGLETSETAKVSSVEFSTEGNSITLAAGGGATASGSTLSGGTADTQAFGYVTTSGGSASITIDGITLSYTANGDDTSGTVAAMLAVMVNADPELQRYVQAVWTPTLPNQVTIKSKLGTLNLAAGLEFDHNTLETLAHVHLPFADVAMGALSRGNVSQNGYKWPLKSRQSSYNRFTITFNDAPQDYQLTELNEDDEAHQASTNRVNRLEVSGACVDNYHQANRLVLAARYKYREGNYFGQIQTTDARALLLEEGDVICVTHSNQPEQRNLLMRVEELQIAPDHKVSITARLYADEQFPTSATERTVPLPTGIGYPSSPPPAISNLVLTNPTAGAINGTFDFGAYLGSQQAKIEIQLPGAVAFTDTGIRVTPDSQNKGAFQITGVTPGLSYVRVTPFSAAGNGPETIGSRDTSPSLAATVEAVSTVSATLSGGTGAASLAATVAAQSAVAAVLSGGTGSVSLAATVEAQSAVTAAFETEGFADSEFHFAARFMALSNDESVVQLSDESGNDRHGTQSTTGARAVFKSNIANGQPALLFSAGQWYDLPNFMTSFTEGELFIVIKAAADPPATSAKSGLLEMGNDLNASHYPFTDGTIYSDFGTGTRKNCGNPTPSLANVTLINIVSKAGEWTMRINGAAFYTTASNTVAWSATPAIGRETSGFSDVYFDGYIFEGAFFSTERTSGERADIVAELAAIYDQAW